MTKERLKNDLIECGIDLTVVCPSIDEKTLPGAYYDVVTLAKTAEELNSSFPNYRFEIVPTYLIVQEGQAVPLQETLKAAKVDIKQGFK